MKAFSALLIGIIGTTSLAYASSGEYLRDAQDNLAQKYHLSWTGNQTGICGDKTELLYATFTSQSGTRYAVSEDGFSNEIADTADYDTAKLINLSHCGRVPRLVGIGN